MRKGPRVREPLPVDALAVRLSTLQIIGAAALGQGLTIVLRQPRSGVSLFTFLPGWPGFYGAALAVFGALLLSGAWVRRPLLTLVGAWGAMVWYLGFGAGFVLQWALWRDDTLNGAEPLVFPAWTYFAVAVVLWAQSDVLLRTRAVERLL